MFQDIDIQDIQDIVVLNKPYLITIFYNDTNE